MGVSTPLKNETGKNVFLRSLRCVALLGSVAGMSACAAPGASTNSYKLVLNAPGLENVESKIDVVRDDYSQIVVRSTWSRSDSAWPHADLKLWRIKDNFRNLKIYVYQYSLPELISFYLPGERIALGMDGNSENVLGSLDYQRFRRNSDAECIFIRQGVSRFSDQINVRGSGKALGDMVIRGWYCVGRTEANQDAAFQGFVQGLGIQGFALP